MIKPWAPLSYNWCSKRPPSSVHFKANGSAPRGILSNTPYYVGIDRCHSCLKSCHEIFDSPKRDCVYLLVQVSPQEKNPSELDPATEEAMQSALHVQFTFLDMSCSTTVGHLPHSALELRRAETTTSASQLEAHLQAAPVEQFPEYHDIVEQSACQVADRGPRQRPRRYQLKRWRWTGLDTHVRG
jgi:ferredoxin